MPGSTQELDGRQSVAAYGAVTLFGRLSHTFPLTDCFVTSICRSYNPVSASRGGLGCSPFARHYWGNGFFSSGYLDVSVPQVPILKSMNSTRGHCWFTTAGFPIRRSSDQRLYTASRGLSQCPTSFFGIWRLGIHHKLLVASPRDAEKLILFAIFDKLLYRPTSSIAIRLLRFCSPVDR